MHKYGWNGFTLAEVLITLTIIGVIAALTIPVLMNNVREKITVEKVRASYSILSSAYKMAVNENGNYYEWGIPSRDEAGGYAQQAAFILDKLTQYLKLQKNCGSVAGRCWPSTKPYKYLNGTTNSDEIMGSGRFHATAQLQNGVSIALYPARAEYDGFYSSDTILATIYIWTEPGKGPEVIGKDLFRFDFKPKGILPAGSNGEMTSCSLEGTGTECAAWVIHKKNMDYLKRKN